jgi:predicted nucleic acid-binding protein
LTRYLLDTNVISNITKPDPSESLLQWMGAQSDGDLFISSLTIAEIQRGILDKPRGKKRERLEAWFAGPEGPQSLFKGRILSFDEKAALLWAGLMSAGRAAGKPRSDLDMIVAAVAEANECVIVTDNEKHFSGLEVLNPLRTSR